MGPNIAAARLRPSATCGWTCKASRRAASSSTPRANTRARARVHWVTRAKENTVYGLVDRRAAGSDKILRDEIILLRGEVPARRIVARVEVNGAEREMTFLSNHFDWSAQTIVDLYRCRWEIEVFFKQIKRTLQLADFLRDCKLTVREHTLGDSQ